MKDTPASSQQRLGYLIVIIIMSFVSGLVGGIVGQKDYQEQVNLLNFNNLTEKIKQQVAKDIEPSDLLIEIEPSIAEVYQYGDQGISKTTKKDTGTQAIDTLTGGIHFEGYALAVTSDGWMIAPTQAVTGTLPNIRIVDSEGTTYTPDKKIDDVATGLSFIKTSAHGMKPISMSSDILTTYPQDHFLIENKTSITPITVTPLGYSADIARNPIQTTTSLKKVYNFSTVFSTLGAPVVTKQKEVIGVTTQNGVIPLAYIQDQLTQVLRTGAIARASLGLNYIDRAWWSAPLKDPKYQDIKTGAIVLTDKKINLVSPQGAVTLSNGDTILAVNQEKVSASRSLSEIIQQYKINDVVTLSVMQNGVQKTYQVSLQ